MTCPVQHRTPLREGDRSSASARAATATAPVPPAIPGDAHGVRPLRSRVARWVLATVGLIAVALGGLGTVVPGLPTTIFLIIASACFVRSCPELEQRLLGARIFAPFRPFLDPSVPMPRRARVLSIALLWLFAGPATAGLAASDAPAFVWPIVLAAAVAGTLVILTCRRGRATGGPAATAAPAASRG